MESALAQNTFDALVGELDRFQQRLEALENDMQIMLADKMQHDRDIAILQRQIFGIEK